MTNNENITVARIENDLNHTDDWSITVAQREMLAKLGKMGQMVSNIVTNDFDITITLADSVEGPAETPTATAKVSTLVLTNSFGWGEASINGVKLGVTGKGNFNLRDIKAALKA